MQGNKKGVIASATVGCVDYPILGGLVGELTTNNSNTYV